MKKEELCSKLFKMYNDKVFDNKVSVRNGFWAVIHLQCDVLMILDVV
jgi:hypothetical protein